MYKQTYKKTQKSVSDSGFSLIEVLVSMSIFAIVVVISVGALLVLIDANTRAQNSQSVITNLSFALDSMTREIRTGRDYFCSNSVTLLPIGGNAVSDCVNGAPFFSFNEGGQSLTGNASSRRIGYRLNSGSLERRLGNGDGNANANEASDWIPVTTSSVSIDSLEFYVSGSTRGDDVAPTVTVYLAGTMGEEADTRTAFNIQTTISQELLDI